MKKMDPYSGKANTWPWQDLLILFNSYPELFFSNAKLAKELRNRLETLLEQERKGLSRTDLQAVLVLKLILLCPELCEIKGRPGFEWVAQNFHEMLAKQAIALGLDLKEKDLSPSSSKVGKSSRRKRIDTSFQNLLQLAKRDLSRLGAPAELARDLLRAQNVKMFEMIYGWNKATAKRFVAGLEGVEKAGPDAFGKRIQVNIGPPRKPQWIDVSNPYKQSVNGVNAPSVESEIFYADSYAPSDRVIQRSLDNVRDAKLELVVEPIKTNDPNHFGAEKWKILVVPRPFRHVMDQCPREQKETKDGS